MLGRTLNRTDILNALQRCLEAEPTINYCLSRDASRLAAVLGEMNYFKRESRDFEMLSINQQGAVTRWLE
jgi:hypothetical protein